MLHDGALSSFGAAIGLFEIPRRLAQSAKGAANKAIQRSLGWIFGAAVIAIFYVFLLGPGIKVAF
jgi:hypothetical protein